MPALPTNQSPRYACIILLRSRYSITNILWRRQGQYSRKYGAEKTGAMKNDHLFVMSMHAKHKAEQVLDFDLNDIIKTLEDQIIKYDWCVIELDAVGEGIGEFCDTVEAAKGNGVWISPQDLIILALRACFKRSRSVLIACGYEQPTLPERSVRPRMGVYQSFDPAG